MIIKYKKTGTLFQNRQTRNFFSISVSILFFFSSLYYSHASGSLITITAVGDIMMGSHFPTSDYLPENNGEFLLKDITSYLSESDIVFGNLEGPLLDEGEIVKKCNDPEKCYAFKTPSKYVKNLTDAGFNLMSIANNHIGDFGLNGIESTMETLSSSEIRFAGVHTHPNTVFELNDIMFGFAAFSPNLATPDPRDIKGAARTVKALKKLCNIVIVSVHAGSEGDQHRRITRQTEIFHDEDRGNVYDFSHAMIDAGADLILGHGPHVSRAVELYKGRFIAYSMGNFCTYGRFNLRGYNGTAPIFRIKITNTGQFVSGQIIPIFQTPGKGPSYDKKKRAIRDIIDLTNTDFPETPLIIDSSGKIHMTAKPSVNVLQN